MNKVRKKFVIYAMIAVFVLLTVLVSIINGINFTMVANDADRVTETIAGERGSFKDFRSVDERMEIKPAGKGNFDRMGPDSPELPYTARYFTFRFDPDGKAELVAFNISSFTEDEALKIAQSLTKERVGWVETYYRYRVYKDADFLYVTVVDQGRELLPSFRILIISVIGEAVGLAICLAFLIIMSKAIFKPIEEADRKQKKFLAEAENEFKIPLTVINANTEVIERTNGQSEQTLSINRQVKKMISLTKKLGTLSVLERGATESEICDLSLIAASATDSALPKFTERGVTFDREVDGGIKVNGDPEILRKTVKEIIENSLKFSKTFASFSLKNENGRISLVSSNDTDLADGPADQVFDRFTRLPNADGVDGNGLGLSFVKETVKSLNGRLSASVSNGVFTLKIAF